VSRENVEIVRAVYERWSEGDFRAAVALFDPHVLFVVGPGFLDPGTYLGIEAIAAFTRSTLLESDRHLTIEAEEIVAAGESVIVDVRQRGVGSASGVPAEMRYFQLWSFRGGKVIRLDVFRERAEALEAAGLRA
jgi:ketosteroid isomerase-like protein